MTFCLYTNSISPHQLPLARELVQRIGSENYRYIYTEALSASRVKLGWQLEQEDWILSYHEHPEEANNWLRKCDVLMSGIRDVELFDIRSAASKKTLYYSERWFKPIFDFRRHFAGGCFGRLAGLVEKYGGRLRMFVPSYRRKANAIIGLAKRDAGFMLYPMGIHAAKDFAWLLGCSINDYERFPGGKFNGDGTYLHKMRLWGYFVEPSSGHEKAHIMSPRLRVLWVGRMLRLKHVDDLIAVAKQIPIELYLYGDGPDKDRLMHMAQGMENVHFHESVTLAKVREIMRKYDVYVLSSNSLEGWGAVVSEALEEGMKVVGTYEAGSSATILPTTNLYHAGDCHALANILSGNVCAIPIDKWSVMNAAEELLRLMK